MKSFPSCRLSLISKFNFSKSNQRAPLRHGRKPANLLSIQKKRLLETGKYKKSWSTFQLYLPLGTILFILQHVNGNFPILVYSRLNFPACSRMASPQTDEGTTISDIKWPKNPAVAAFIYAGVSQVNFMSKSWSSFFHPCFQRIFRS